MNDQQRISARDLLIRARVSSSVLDICDDDKSLLVALATIEDLRGDNAPDVNWFRDYFLITGDYMVLVDEGWVPAEYNTREHTGEDPEEVLDEVNAPASAKV